VVIGPLLSSAGVAPGHHRLYPVQGRGQEHDHGRHPDRRHSANAKSCCTLAGASRARR